MLHSRLSEKQVWIDTDRTYFNINAATMWFLTSTRFAVLTSFISYTATLYPTSQDSPKLPLRITSNGISVSLVLGEPEPISGVFSLLIRILNLLSEPPYSCSATANLQERSINTNAHTSNNMHILASSYGEKSFAFEQRNTFVVRTLNQYSNQPEACGACNEVELPKILGNLYWGFKTSFDTKFFYRRYEILSNGRE
jgi:hypothetical protein